MMLNRCPLSASREGPTSSTLGISLVGCSTHCRSAQDFCGPFALWGIGACQVGLVQDSGLDASSQYPSLGSFTTPVARLMVETRGVPQGFLSYYHVMPSSRPSQERCLLGSLLDPFLAPSATQWWGGRELHTSLLQGVWAGWWPLCGLSLSGQGHAPNSHTALCRGLSTHTPLTGERGRLRHQSGALSVAGG